MDESWISLLAPLTPDELHDLQRLINARLLLLAQLGPALSTPDVAPQRITFRLEHVTCPNQGCHCRTPGGAKHGPYWYAYATPAATEDGVPRSRKRYIGKQAPPVLSTAQIAAGQGTTSAAAVAFYADLAMSFTQAMATENAEAARTIAAAMPDPAPWLAQVPSAAPPPPHVEALQNAYRAALGPALAQEIIALATPPPNAKRERGHTSWSPTPDMHIVVLDALPPSTESPDPLRHPNQAGLVKLRREIDSGLAALAPLKSVSQQRGRPLLQCLFNGFTHAVTARLQWAVLMDRLETTGPDLYVFTEERMQTLGAWLWNTEWSAETNNALTHQARDLQWASALRHWGRDYFLLTALDVVHGWDAAMYVLAAVWRQVPAGDLAAAQQECDQVRQWVEAWMGEKTSSPEWHADTAPDWFWQEPPAILRPVRTERGSKAHLSLDQDHTLCGKYTDLEGVAVTFTPKDCQHCRTQATKRQFVCQGCGQLLLAAWDVGLCYRCVGKR